MWQLMAAVSKLTLPWLSPTAGLPLASLSFPLHSLPERRVEDPGGDRMTSSEVRVTPTKVLSQLTATPLEIETTSGTDRVLGGDGWLR